MSVRHTVRVHPSAERLPRSEQLAWALAQLAADPVEVDPDVVEMIVNRVIDDTAVATASLTRAPVVAARAQAQAHPVSRGGVGATVVGLERSARTSPEWAAWANGVRNLTASLDAVLCGKAEHAMPLQRYDIRRPDGTWEVRHWKPRNIPILDANGEVEVIIHHAEDVTQAVLAEHRRAS